MKNIYYITNMFPGKNDNYGIFCEKVYNFFEKSDDFCVKRLSAIYGKSHKKLYNIFRYIFLLISITKTLIFSIKKIDLIYIQYIWKHAFFFSNFCPYIKKGNKKLVINFHGEDLTNYSLLSIKEKKSFIRLCMYADLIIVPSVYFKNLLISQLAFCETKIFVSPSGGVNSKNFFKTKKLNTGKTTLVYCSRFDSDKGWDDFILGIKSLSEKKIELKAKMIGYGKQLNDVFNLIEKLGLNGIIDVYNNVSQDIMASIYTQSTLFVFPTRRCAESLGLVALEAMSCGLPIIASNIGAISEYVINNQNGRLYKSGDIDDLVNKIENTINLSEENYKILSDNALKTALEYKDNVVEQHFIDKLKFLFSNTDVIE